MIFVTRWATGTLVLIGIVMAGQGYANDKITQAQPKLPTAKLTITSRDGQNHDFDVELARTPAQQEIGEMFRAHIPANEGMLFVWPQPQNADMWMRNTLVPLDILFIDTTQHIHAIVEHAVPLSEAILSSQGIVASTLELPGGAAERLNLRVGDKVSGSAFDQSQHP